MSTESRSVPSTWNVSLEWMQNVVRGQYPSAELSSFKRVGGTDGTSSRALFALEYTGGSGPRTVFAKSKGNWLRRVLQYMTGNAFIEGRLYESRADLRLEHPVFYYGAVDTRRLNDVIVMEDVSQRGAILNEATTPLSVDAVGNGLQELAKMHSSFWNYSADTHPQLNWVQQWESTRMFRFLLKFGCKRGTACLLDWLPESVVSPGPMMMVDAWTDYLQSICTGPQTLLHGDAHVGNTYLLPDGTLGFYDWGVVRRGHWSFDVGYFIISCLSKEDCRKHAKDLLQVYIDALDIAEAKPSIDEAWLRFRCSPAYGLAIWVTTGAEDGYQKPEICQALSERFSDAFVELDTLAALREITVS